MDGQLGAFELKDPLTRRKAEQRPMKEGARGQEVRAKNNLNKRRRKRRLCRSRERHEWAGALIIDRVIKADEEGFFFPRCEGSDCWSPPARRPGSTAAARGSGSMRSMAAERGSVSHTVRDD